MYLIVAALIILIRAFYAGTRHVSFERPNFHGKLEHSEEAVLVYVLKTVGVAATWPISLPIIGVYMLGKRLYG